MWLDRIVSGWIIFVAICDVIRQGKEARRTGKTAGLGLALVFSLMWFYAAMRLWR